MGEATGVERLYRRRRRLPGVFFGTATAVLAVGLLEILGTDDSRLRRWGLLGLGLVFVGILVKVPLDHYRAYTRVTADGVTAQWAVRSRTWTWQEVYDIRVERVQGEKAGAMYPTWMTYLYDFEGRRYSLPQVTDWQLDDPVTEISVLRLDAAPHRGLRWEQRHDVEERIVRRTAQRKARIQKAVWAMALVIVAAVLVVSRP
ncbi:hypothetical protein [Streptomyces sp. NPDC001980]|uniref:hypothetical protein n=1 Tax=Streptomyces sp. NPDC001980 TaxID=3157126 RepID=UPI00332B1C76